MRRAIFSQGESLLCANLLSHRRRVAELLGDAATLQLLVAGINCEET